jgi:hypothetical protein
MVNVLCFLLKSLVIRHGITKDTFSILGITHAVIAFAVLAVRVTVADNQTWSHPLLIQQMKICSASDCFLDSCFYKMYLIMVMHVRDIEASVHRSYNSLLLYGKWGPVNECKIFLYGSIWSLMTFQVLQYLQGQVTKTSLP